jgi:hypothetical protein
MMNVAEHKAVTLGRIDLPADEAKLVAAQRRLARARERAAEADAMLRRLTADSELFGKPVDAETQRVLDANVTESTRLVESIEAEIEHLKLEPARRARREKKGAELLGKARELDAKIAAAVDALAAALHDAEPVVDAIRREFMDPALGFRTLLPPFVGSQVVSRLTFLKDDLSKERIRNYKKERI